ncbi:hypothetical protein B0T16DRAFT_393399 [Cercophora newfieldiana]|uniref:AMP-dependent synthetase/ligase domain-containing protein n=1 Tax=Cercophora newfieldiana TaxID=92897 RepID=A0AA39XXW6_9PEZI|nr:hypothetical protein B0T16DRAFT_393399 [Cercophora newfieldiana]
MPYNPKVGPTPLYIVHKPPFSVEAQGYEPVEGETIPRVHPKARNGLITRPSPDVATVYDLIKRTATLHGEEPAVGSRKLIKIHKEKKKIPKKIDGEVVEVEKEWTFYELSKYSFLTYNEYFTMALQVGSGLRKLGLSAGDKVHIFAATSPQWLNMSHACSTQSMTLVTAYDTLGESGVQHSLVQSKPSAIMVDPHLLKTISNPLRKAPSVKILIYNQASHMMVPEQQIEEFKSSHPELTVMSFEELRALGEANPAAPVPPKADDLYCIMYTSGSTGTPKGVPTTHAGFIAAVTGIYHHVEEIVSHHEYVMAYLPLAHIFELVVENTAVYFGATLGYGHPRSLSDGSMRNCPGDIRAFGPSLLIGVPQVWESIRKGVEAKVNESGLLTRTLFWGAFKLKSFMVSNGLPFHGMFDNIVFGKVRKQTGGRLRFLVNGASGISWTTQHFMSMVVAPMLNGYGLTETGGNGALGSPLEWTTEAIGPMEVSLELKLVALPELGYHTNRTPPQGEILLRGPPVLTAYYENPEETAAAVTPDGWFRTGDIGEFDKNGHVKVIDRVKNLVKMQGGEYIALEKLEAVYRGCPYVMNLVVHGDSEHPRPIAVIIPNEKAVAEKAAELGVDEHVMYQDSKVKDAVLKALGASARGAGLTPMETVAGLVLLGDQEWTPANGMVTATQKPNRRVIREKNEKAIAACLAGL